MDDPEHLRHLTLTAISLISHRRHVASHRDEARPSISTKSIIAFCGIQRASHLVNPPYALKSQLLVHPYDLFTAQSHKSRYPLPIPAPTLCTVHPRQSSKISMTSGSTLICFFPVASPPCPSISVGNSFAVQLPSAVTLMLFVHVLPA